MAKCPKCEEEITHVHYEGHRPNEADGYDGSKSFTAVAYPCGHALGALPVTWESRLDELEHISRKLDGKIDFLQGEILDVIDVLKALRKKIS
jgi:hypothetical protein